MIFKEHPGCNRITKEEHLEFVRRMDAMNDAQNSRLDKLEATYEKLSDINISVQTMSANLLSLTEELKKNSQRMEKLEESTVTANQLNGFGKRLELLERETISKLTEIERKSEERFDVIEKHAGQKAVKSNEEWSMFIKKTVIGIVVTGVAVAVLKAILPYLAF